MDNFNSVDLVKSICKERKIAISRLEADCGFSNGYIRGLREGRFPADRMLKISKYLDLPVEYLTTGRENPPDYLYTDENADFLIEITRMAKDRIFVERIKKYMSLVDESRKSVDDMIDFLYEKENREEL